MGLFGRSRRSFKIAPGLRMNLGRSGVSGLGLTGFGLVVVMAGFCSSVDNDPPRYTPSPSPPAYSADSVRSPADTETFYVHGSLNVRTGPGTQYPSVRMLSRGDLVRLGPGDANGWAELRTYGGAREGYVYRASDLVRRSPASASEPSSSGRGRRSSDADREYHTGPKGGCYYTYGDSERKRYVDRSYCN